MSLQIKWSYLFILFFSFFLLSGCGTDNSVSSSNAPVTPSGSVNTIAYMSSNMLNNSVTVGQNSQSVSIQIQALNKSGVPVSEGEVLVQYPNMPTSSTGSMSPAKAQVNSDGMALFTYTAPNDIQTLIDNNITQSTFTFYDNNNTSVFMALNIVYDTTADTSGDGPVASIILSDPSIIVAESKQEFPISVYAFNAAGTGVSEAVLGVEYDATALENNRDVGTIPNEVVITNGVGTLNYIGPEDLAAAGAIDPSEFKIFYKEDSSVSTTLTASFVQESSAITRLRVVENPIALTSDSEQLSVRVLALNNNNQPVNNGTIVVEYPAAANNGFFAQNEIEVSNGVAVFDYTAPSDLTTHTSAVSWVFTFKLKEKTYVSTTQTFTFTPPEPDANTDVAGTIWYIIPNAITVNQNNQIFNVSVPVFDANRRPFDGGVVKIIYPQEVLDGDDVGTFNVNEANLTNGVAEFIYTGPRDISLVDGDNVNFEFYHQVGSATGDTRPLPISFTSTVGNKVNATYEVKLASSDGNYTTTIESLKYFNAYIVDDAGSTEIEVLDMNVTTLNPVYAQFIDPTGGADLATRRFNESTASDKDVNNNKLLGVQTYRKSGLVSIEVTVTYINADGETDTITEIFDIVIFSGPPTAMSISYVGTDQNEANAQFIEQFSVKLTDKYNNPVNSNPMISVGALAGYVGNVGDQPPSPLTAYSENMYVTDDLSGTGQGSIITVGNEVRLVDDDILGRRDFTTAVPKETIDIYNDVVVVFGNGYTYEVSGKWDIASIDAHNTIILDDSYQGTDFTGLGFAIGNNHRQDTCRFGEEWVVTADSEDGTYKVDNDGFATIKLSYDYYMTGKEIVVYVNLIGDVLGVTDETMRLGEAKKHGLRGHALTPIPEAGYDIPKNSTARVPFHIEITDTAEWYRNGNFAYAIIGDNVSCTIHSTSDRRDCLNTDGASYNEGIAWVVLECTTGDDDGTVKLEDVVIATEFR